MRSPISHDLSTEPAAHRFPRRPPQSIDYRQLRRIVSLADVLSLLNWKPAKVHGPQLRGPCPLHKGRPESVLFAANTKRNIWFCHSPKCKVGGNQLDLWMQLSGLSLFDAAVDLCQKTGRDVPLLSGRAGAL